MKAVVLIIIILFIAVVYASVDDKTSPNAYYIGKAFIAATTPKKVKCPFPAKIRCKPTSPYRSLEGTCNNLKNPLLGSIETPHKRFLTPAYDDGFGMPRVKSVSGGNLPNPRLVSTKVNSDNSVFERIWTNIFVIFGQFVTHDIALTANTNSK
jgi:hypothetical protein